MTPERRAVALVHGGLLALSLLAWGAGLLEPLEMRLLDHRFRVRGPRAAHPDVQLVGITQSCIEFFDRWPIPRSVYAAFARKLRAVGATAVGFDLVLDGPSTTAEDGLLAAGVRETGAVLAEVIQERKVFVDGALVTEKAVVRPYEPFAPPGQPVGFINTAYENVNVDGILRALPLRERVGADLHDAFSLALLRRHLAARPADAPRAPFDPDAEPAASFRYINFYGPANQGVAWTPLSAFFDGTLDSDQIGAFRGKVVVFGPMAAALGDIHHGPYGTMPGVEVHATILSNALAGDFLRRPGLLPLLAFALPFALLLGRLAERGPLRPYALAGAAGALLHAGLAYALFSRAGLILEILPVSLFALAAVLVTCFRRLHLDLWLANRTLSRKIDELKALYEISKTIADIENLDAVLRRVLAIAVDVLGATRGSLMLFHEETERLRVEVMHRFGDPVPGERADTPHLLAGQVAAADAPAGTLSAGASAGPAAAGDAAEPAPEDLPGVPRTIEFAPGEGVAGICFDERRPVIVNRGSRDPRFKAKQERDRDIESLLCVPMMLKDRCVGVINISNKRDGSDFGATDSTLMEMVAHHAATVIENARLYKLATVDGMTGLYVHRYFKIRMREEFLRAIRYRKSISVILTDIDHFKKFNDTYGHQIGDLVLTAVAGVLRETVRMSDFPARYGGEEFIVILPETEAEGAHRLAERVRERVEARTLRTAKGDLSVTLSAGVATFPDSAARTADELISFADAALYKAKATGRNRTCVYR